LSPSNALSGSGRRLFARQLSIHWREQALANGSFQRDELWGSPARYGIGRFSNHWFAVVELFNFPAN
jgi:hypothetical protein